MDAEEIVFKDRIAENKRLVNEYIALHQKEYKNKGAFKDALNKQIQELKIPDRMKNLNQIIFLLDIKRAL